MSIKPKLGLGLSGPSIKGEKLTSVENNKHIRELLRPALVAANTYDVKILWHMKLLGGVQGENRYESIAEKYTISFLQNIIASENTELLYIELEQHAELILEKLGRIVYKPNIKMMISDEIAPYLRIYANTGTDSMLESLCALALCIESESIDSVLSELFHRWYYRFDRMDRSIQHHNNHQLWKAFNRLVEHPRFTYIPSYDVRLLEILNCNLYWLERDYIIRALKDSPSFYTKVEQMLIKAAPFEHYGWDEVDQLDEFALKFFSEVND